jgi:hypothetical protein
MASCNERYRLPPRNNDSIRVELVTLMGGGSFGRYGPVMEPRKPWFPVDTGCGWLLWPGAAPAGSG